MNNVKKIYHSFTYSWKGFRHAYNADKSFRLEIQYGLPIYIFLGWYLAPFTALELILFIFSYLLILLVELINTAFEKMIDKLHPEQHEVIGRSKDIASAAVMVAFVFAGFVIVVLALTRVTSDVGGVLISHPFV